MFLKSVSYLSLGSNLGIKVNNLANTLYLLNHNPKIQIKQVSSVYLTEPVEFADQPYFLNIVVEIATRFSPEELLYFIHEVEKKIGRKKTFEKGPRVIDIDILTFDEQVIDTESLKVPHPGVFTRNFMIRPLMELNPQYILPVKNVLISEYIEKNKLKGIIKKIDLTLNY